MPRASSSKSPRSARSVTSDPSPAAAKRTTGRPFAKGADARRGRGPKKGAANAGRPPDILRAALLTDFADRRAILTGFADGQAIVHTRVRIADVIPHICCANCGESQLKPKDPDTAPYIEIEAVTSPSPKDRIHALETMLKYGPGQPPQEIKGKFTGKATISVVIRREGRRITAS